jgi:hypothetical protein
MRASSEELGAARRIYRLCLYGCYLNSQLLGIDGDQLKPDRSILNCSGTYYIVLPFFYGRTAEFENGPVSRLQKCIKGEV